MIEIVLQAVSFNFKMEVYLIHYNTYNAELYIRCSKNWDYYTPILITKIINELSSRNLT